MYFGKCEIVKGTNSKNFVILRSLRRENLLRLNFVTFTLILFPTHICYNNLKYKVKLVLIIDIIFYKRKKEAADT